MIVQRNRQLVGLKTALIGHLDTDNPTHGLRSEWLAVNGQHRRRGQMPPARIGQRLKYFNRALFDFVQHLHPRQIAYQTQAQQQGFAFCPDRHIRYFF